MTRSLDLTRRLLLGASAAGVSLAFAGQAGARSSAASRSKLVFVIARGAMDGLSVVVPKHDANYRPLRGALAIENSLPLSDGFGLHPALAGLHTLYGQGQMRFAPAVSIPVRVRSHFDAQDVLENGGEGLRQQTDGWLNRALAATGGLKGLSIGAQTPLILRGSAATSSWAPGGRTGSEDRIASLLQDLYVEDRLLAENLAAGLQTEAQAMAMGGDARLARNDVAGLGQAVARLMTGPDGADVVALSVDGWDTHARQVGQLQARLTGLDQVVSGLRTGLGEDWNRTVLVIATEFGRTARANGTGGTDHGTGSALLMAGGPLKPGGMIGDWPTLADNRLFEDRDLAPTVDVRSVFKAVLRDHLGIDRAALDTRVFPASAGETPPQEGLF